MALRQIYRDRDRDRETEIRACHPPCFVWIVLLWDHNTSGQEVQPFGSNFGTLKQKLAEHPPCSFVQCLGVAVPQVKRSNHLAMRAEQATHLISKNAEF
jgi:hypothetical protein